MLTILQVRGADHPPLFVNPSIHSYFHIFIFSYFHQDFELEGLLDGIISWQNRIS
jgi:hypothetical protein